MDISSVSGVGSTTLLVVTASGGFVTVPVSRAGRSTAGGLRPGAGAFLHGGRYRTPGGETTMRDDHQVRKCDQMVFNIYIGT